LAYGTLFATQLACAAKVETQSDGLSIRDGGPFLNVVIWVENRELLQTRSSLWSL